MIQLLFGKFRTVFSAVQCAGYYACRGSINTALHTPTVPRCLQALVLLAFGEPRPRRQQGMPSLGMAFRHNLGRLAGYVLAGRLDIHGWLAAMRASLK